MAAVRVFLFTYRRPSLLRRALQSLLGQTFTDWICELHNDDPTDPEPRAVLTELAGQDARFIYCAHETNLGPIRTFNLAFAGGPEPFAAILEDDNWWEPEMLATLLRVLARRTDASLAWANMRIWDEHADGSWRDTGRNVWHRSAGAPESVVFHPPELLQAVDALHSQGAMVFRPSLFRSPHVLESTPLSLIEPLRERDAIGPLILVTTPLANFARTLRTARDRDSIRWLQAKLLLAASFFHSIQVRSPDLVRLWKHRRALVPRDTDFLFNVALSLGHPALVQAARLADWWHLALHSLAHPPRVLRGLRFRSDHPELWSLLLSRSSTWPSPARATVLAKEVPAAVELPGDMLLDAPVPATTTVRGATVRVFVPTFRRPHLLPRALRSLQAQTRTDWVAEVRNDAPEDPRPAEIVRAAADPRIQCVPHSKRRGATAIFNEAYGGHAEPFAAILEDDNCWHPPFLATMLQSIQAHPGVVLAWSNQDRWAEQSDGSWQDTGHPVRQIPTSERPFLVRWPQAAQCFGALHANGSMLIRSTPGVGYQTPAMPFGGSEAVRERCLPHPLLYVPQTLGVFAVTRETNRSHNHGVWGTTQVLLAASFLKHAAIDRAAGARLWGNARRASPAMTGILIFATRQERSLRRFLEFVTPDDWRSLALRTARRPLVFLKLLRARQRKPELWHFLDVHTGARTAEAKANGGSSALVFDQI
jgi:glycosyltransferase involved in cell wall biosynthesis